MSSSSERFQNLLSMLHISNYVDNNSYKKVRRNGKISAQSSQNFWGAIMRTKIN